MENRTKRIDKRKSKKKFSKKTKVITIIASIILIPIIVAGIYVLQQLNKIKTVPLNKTDSALGIKSGTNDKLSKDVINIALFGTDTRVKDQNGNSDTIMIASIDKIHNKIKLTSIMRDTRVNIDGLGMQKINAAYQNGGPALAIKTINQNFELNIKDYVSVDFFGMAKIIDSMGGVSIDVQKDEIQWINGYMTSTPGIDPKLIKPVKNAGVQNLTGTQAVAYARIRYTAGNDFMRTERQRTVLTALLTKIQQSGASKYPSVATSLLPFTETSLSSTDIISLGTSVLASGIKTIDQERFPVDGYCNGQTISGVWYLVPVPDLKTTVNQIYDYLYNDKKPVPLKPLT